MNNKMISFKIMIGIIDYITNIRYIYSCITLLNEISNVTNVISLGNMFIKVGIYILESTKGHSAYVIKIIEDE